MVLVSVLAKMHGVNEVNCCPTEKAKTKSGFSQNKVKIPEYVGQSILSLLVFVLGATMKGNSIKSHYVPILNVDLIMQ